MGSNNNDEKKEIAFERLVGDSDGPKTTIEYQTENYGSPKGLLMGGIQGGFNTYNEDEDDLAEVHTEVETVSGMPAQESETQFLDIETEEDQ